MGEDWSVSFLSQGFVTYESYERTILPIIEYAYIIMRNMHTITTAVLLL